MNKLTIDLEKIRQVLWNLGWYHLSIRINNPENRAEQFKGEWTDALIKEYLERHCGKEEYKKIS